MKKKRIISILLIILITIMLTSCGSDKEEFSNQERPEPIVNIKELSQLTLEDAKNKYGELQDSGPLEEDGLKARVYTTTDGKHEFVFVEDGGKLYAYYIFLDQPIEVVKEIDLFYLIGVEELGDDYSQTHGVYRFKNLDKEGILKEAYFLTEGYQMPTKLNLIQLWFK